MAIKPKPEPLSPQSMTLHFVDNVTQPQPKFQFLKNYAFAAHFNEMLLLAEHIHLDMNGANVFIDLGVGAVTLQGQIINNIWHQVGGGGGG